MKHWRCLFTILALLPGLSAKSESSSEKYGLILYLNETSPEGAESRAYATLKAWLKASDDKEVRDFAERLDQDPRDFKITVDKEIGAVETANANGWLSSPVIIFTNKMARDHKFMLFQPAQKNKELKPIAYALKDKILEANPLASPEFLRLAIAAASEVLPPKTKVIMVTKSHGNDEMALVPLIRLWPQDTNPRELAGIVKRILKDQKKSNPVLPHNAHLLGTTKDQFFDALDHAPFTIALEFMESCYSGPPTVKGDPATYRLPSKVEEIYASLDQGTRYQNINYNDMLKKAHESGDLLKAFAEALRPQFYHLTRVSRLQQLMDFLKGHF